MRMSICFVESHGNVTAEACVFRTIGWYHGQMAQKSLPDVEASIGHRHSAAESYLIAADVFPEDDERHVCE